MCNCECLSPKRLKETLNGTKIIFLLFTIDVIYRVYKVFVIVDLSQNLSFAINLHFNFGKKCILKKII